MATKLILLSAGGAAGTLLRYGLMGLFSPASGPPSPLGTILVNAVGCLIFGFIWSVADARHWIGPAASVSLLAGFCGALTTFSAYSFDAHRLATREGMVLAGGYILAQNLLGIMLIFSGLWIGRVCSGPVD